MNLKKKLYIQIDPEAWPRSGLSQLNQIISLVVIICVLSAILETEPVLAQNHAVIFKIINKFFLYIFTIEYIIRLWVMVENEKFSGPFGRLKYIFSLPALIDLITVLPFWFGAGSEILLMRMLRFLRILKLARIPGVSQAIKRISDALLTRKMELSLSVLFSILLMLVASTTLYLLERTTQPDVFGSIPRAMWWGIATLTTVGYGDVYPVTVLGKLAAGLYAFAGIGLVAMPTGIFAAAMSEVTANSSDQ